MAMSLNHPGPLHADGLSVLNANPAKLPGPRFLHELVPQAANNVLSCAIDFLAENDRRVVLSYPQLHAASLALASRILCILRSTLAQSASTLEHSGPLIIPILSSQSPQLYVAILAVLKAGGAFCPLNTDAPPERVRFILDDVKAKIVLVNRALASKLPTGDGTYTAIFIDDVIDTLETDGEDLHCIRELTPQDLAYVMYTSGSTGTPKGVAVSHLAATQSILAHDRHIPSFSRFLQFAAPTFDVSVFEIFFPLFRGATLVGCNRAEMLTNLVGILTKMEVDACELTPSVANSLLKQRSRAPLLRLLLTIGEMLTEPVIQEFGGNELKKSMLWGMYGPTEAAIHCTVQNAFATTSDRGTIGIPLDTVSAFVIRISTDPNVNFKFGVLPTGETGELALGGLQLASCYLNRPQQTTNSFVDTPWGRVYRTGDKARIRPDGTIECLGRIDDSQVKLNGQRLELGEVEQALLRTPGCHGAVAAVISNVLVAFAAMDQSSDSNAQLWAQCRSWLPSFMVPTDIITTEQLPQLPSGKIDRKRLIHDYSVRTKNVRGNEVPIDDFERLLCEVAAAVLSEQIGPLTDFSAANMDSLAAIEYASALRENGVCITPVDILSAKSPRELRLRVGDMGRPTISLVSESDLKTHQLSDPFREKVRLRPVLGDQIEEIDRLERPTPLQQSMVAETLKDGHLYINQIELEVISDATLDVLQSSLRKLAECNEILRTGFTFVENQLCQVIWKRLDESQVYYVEDGGNSTAQIEDAEFFLLRPLRIEVRPPSPERSALTLFLTLHHAIYDGWTVDLIIEDLSLLLSNEQLIRRPQFSQVMGPLHHVSQVNSVDSMEFWTEHLRGVGAAPVPNFRTITTPQQQRIVNVTQISVHPKDLKNLMLKISVGPQVLFQACLLWLWATVHGTEDITIGCVSSGRSLPVAGIDKLMGPCMTTLPLRINISKYRTIIELLQSIHSFNREVLRYGNVPLSQINTAAGLSRSSKLFDVIFAYQESLASRKHTSNVVREMWHRDATEANLVVEIQPRGDHFICQTTSQAGVLPQVLVETFTHHFGSLVSHFISHVDAPVASIFECFSLDSLSHFNSNPKAIETYSSLSEMVETSALRYPSKTALYFAESLRPPAVSSVSFTYQELNSKANQIARHLQQCGLVSGGVIAIIMEKSPLLYCSILGILKTGCAYLPILPTTPSGRVKVILDQAEPYMCIVDAVSSPLVFGRDSPKVINIETVTLSSYSDANVARRGGPLDLAYVIYTSGTTGTPKGVAVTNRNILSNINVLSSLYPHDPSDRMLQACSQAFDVSVFEIFFAWANGMCLCAATNDTLFEDFEHAVREFKITHLSLTVTVASLLDPENVPSVNFLVTSGEPMTDEVLNRWAQYLYQGYGPSETTNICTVRKVSRGDSSQFLGWSFENTSTFVLYPGSTNLAPLGCKGELCFGGDQVASGYLRLLEETATRFINHPSYGRLYRSGDLGRMLPDGSLIIHGRMDTQVKLRGLRIELQEIQTIALNTGLTKVCRSILITHKEKESHQLALFYVPSGTEINSFKLLSVTTDTSKDRIRALRHALQSTLPDYMIPSFIFPISTLPLTSSGKVDERALHTAVSELSNSALESYSPDDDEADIHPDWSTTELLIADVITDFLPQDRKKLGRWTTFSMLGLDSISAMPIARKLQSTLQKRIPLSLLLQNPNISRLASAIDGLATSRESSPSQDPLLPDDLIETLRKRFSTTGNSVAKILPCTPLQEAMIMSSLKPSSATSSNGVAYYNQMLFHLRIPYEVMIGLWNDIVQRHEILRTLFVTTEDIKYPAVQVVLDSYVSEWKVLNTKDVSLQEHASQHVTSSSITADTNAPPMALAIIRTDDTGDYLSFVCHHAMYDGISMRLILSEIETLYYGKHLPDPPSIEPFLRQIISSRPSQDTFWRQLFLDFQPISLTCPRLTKDTMPRTLSATASQTSLQSIESQLQSDGVSMLAFVHTIWAITLSILSQKKDISFGSVTAGRSIALDEVDKLVAPCFNTLPIRMDLSTSKFLIEVMKKFQSLNAKMMLYQFTKLRHIQKEVGAQTRLFDTLVILQPSTDPLDDKIWSLEYEDGFMDVPIVCEVIPDKLQNTFTIQLHRDKSKFSYEALQLIVNIFSHVLDTCIRYPSSHIFMREALPGDYREAIPKLFHCPEHSHTPDSSLPSPAPNYEQDWSELELRVRQTLAKLAQVPEHLVQRLAPIYQYGLDSIAAIQLANLLRQQSLSISAIDVIEKPTCAGIAAAIENSVKEDIDDIRDFSTFHKETERDILEFGIDPETIEVALPCTATQQGLLSQFLDSKGRYYFNYSSWVLNMAIDSETIVQAWSQLSNCHQILRTGFIPVNHSDSTFAMIVYTVDHFKVPVKICESGTFQREQWLSDTINNSLNTMALPPWQLILEMPGTTSSEEAPTIHLAMHHALYDAFTLRTLLQDLSELISHDIKPTVTDIGQALSHHLSLVGLSQATGEVFWKEKVDSFASHKFPTMTPLHESRPDTLTTSSLCEVSSSDFRRAASEVGITLQAALQAAWTRLLSAYTGESRVAFGIVLDGRTTDLARKTTLPMITTVPVIADNIASNDDLIKQMMQYNSELRRFQFMPMAQIQRCLGTADAIFDTILIYQAIDRSSKPLPVHVVDEIASVEYPISLEVEELPSNTTRLTLSYRASLLPRKQATLLLSQFESILTELLFPTKNDASLTINRPDLFSILPPISEMLPIHTYLLHELLENSAQLIPSAVALEFVDDIGRLNNPRRWTYQEMDILGNQIAHFIVNRGIRPGSIIATCFNKCPIAYFTLLGILKAGCAFLCLDPSAPATRQAFILGDSNAVMLMLAESFDWTAEVSLPVHMVSENLVASLPSSGPPLQRQILPSDPCYCLYTSGTTGTPKGCLISHENATQAMAAFKYLFDGRWNSDSRWLQFAAFHFDVSVLEQYWSWYVGITVVAAPKDVILSDLAMTISKLGITHIDLTPSLARLITPDECPTLCKGVFITGGEKLRSDILEVWGSERVIHNAYGPTEATIGVTMYRGVPQNGRPSNIGNLFPNVGAYVLERGSEMPVLRGGVGELCVSGKLVGIGYLNREALTQERFPVLQASGERVYRTGDLVRVLHDDSLDFIGRADDQVKLRGQRLEIGEINHAIREGLADKAGDVATIVTKRRAQDVDLLVSFVAESSNSNTTQEVDVYYDATHIKFAERAHEACRSCLAMYMVPSFIICVSRIPLSSNNKVDVNQLKKIFSELSHEQLQTLSVSSVSSHRAFNNVEREVLKAIEEVVRVKESNLTPTTTVFQLGIDSITASRLAKRLRAVGFASATPSMILRHPQIGQLSQALDRARSSVPSNNSLQFNQSIKALRHRYLGLACESLEAKKSEVEYIAPCTPLQQGIIARSRVRETQSAYFNQFHLHLDPSVSIGRLKAAFSRIITSCSILRTGFIDTSEGVLQVAIKNRPLRWFEVETAIETFNDTVSTRQRLWVESNREVLKWPVEVDHIRTNGQNHLLLRLFHGVYDARSLNVILESLKAEYEGTSRLPGPAFISVLPDGPLRSHQGSHQFWKSLLKHHRFQPMPRLINTPAAISSVVNKCIQFDGLENTRKKLQVTHQTLLQAAWLYTLRPYFVDPPTIGVILSGRSLAINDLDLVVGPLFNTLPLRVDFATESSWASVARKIQELNNSILAFVHTPLRDIQKLCANGQPLFDTLFTFDIDYKAFSEDKRALWSMADSPGHPDYPLAIELIMVADDMLRVTLAAQGSIADEQSLSALLDRFTDSLRSIITADSNVILSYGTQETLPDFTKGDSEPASEPEKPTDSHMVPPQNPFEWNQEAHNILHELALLAEVDEKEISEKTNLFALGLDSIDVIKLAGRLSKLGYQVSVAALMKQPTLERIINSLVKPQFATTSPSSISEMNNIVSVLEECYQRTNRELSDIEAVLPPTPLQDSMVAAMLHSGFHTYFNHDIIELPEDIDIERLKTAVSTVYANSPILRTVFIEVDDSRIDSAYYQVIRKHELEFSPVTQVSNLGDTCKLTDMARIYAAANNGASGLFQVRFAELGTRKLMILSIAHALYDGSSLGMLHEDIRAAYEGHYTPRQPYRHYLLDMVSRPKSSSEEFWTDLLHGVHATLVPKANTKSGGDTVYRIEKQSKMSAADIRALCKALHATPQVIGQACWAAVVASLTKSLDVVFGVVLSGRDTEDAQGLMFPTMNTVPLRLALHGTVIEFIEYCQDIISGVIEFQQTPLRDIQKLSPSHDGQLFNTIFLLQNSSDRDTSRKPFFRSAHSVSAVEYPLCAELELTGESVVWRIACDENYMNSQGVENLGVSLEKALEYFARDFSKQVLEISTRDTQTVSICGLAPVTLQTDVEGQQSNSIKERLSSQETDSQLHSYDTILEVLSDLCKVDRQAIDLSLSIFHIGLDSISAIKASSILRKRGLNISTRDLVTIPSIRGILEQANQVADGNSEVSVKESLRLNSIISIEEIRTLLQQYGIEENSTETILPALPMQVHMLSVWQNSHGATFFPKFTFRITGPIDVLALHRAWVHLVSETAMLRTHLIRTGSSSLPFLQVVMKSTFTDKHATNIMTTSGDMGFVYAATPFAVAQVLVAGSDKAVLNLYLHHGLYDGVSLPIILDRFARFCSDVSAAGPPVPKTPWYKFVLEHYASTIQDQRRSFWTMYLHGSTAVQMYMTQGDLTNTKSLRVSEFRRTTINSSGLGLQSSTYGVSTQAFLFAAYAKAFAQRRRQYQHINDDVDCVFGIYLANRSSYPGLEDAPFPTLNILPLRVKTPLSRTIVAIATDIQKDIAEISRFENSTASLWEIHDWTGMRIDTFVNILSRPDVTSQTGNPVTIQEITNEESSPAGGVDMSMHCVTPDHESIASNVVRHAYPEAVDIEIATCGNELDLGIFGPSSILSESQAKDMVAAILAEIEAL
ncbi:putative non-ribosomal peptide synthetase [Xylaria bambusicola]|uniref:putative non-ribosomal peptide synthetase n=1 Tax=Xylaria bambusicola TaxID=326684 RepID=UPI002008C8B5|nr:putative non-ribosomal peptide synthetase [Xylaria bambusicola]KAI0505733.1 putative non-ribosomal peptide synthetase [Xylaria bambusicola]